MPMHNFTECSDNYSKTFGSLRLYYRDEPFLNNNGSITDSPSFKFNTKKQAE